MKNEGKKGCLTVQFPHIFPHFFTLGKVQLKKNVKNMTTAVVFDHRGRTKSGKEGPVEIRVTHENRTFYINTTVKVRKSEFNHGEIVNRIDAPELNRILEAVVKRVTEAIAELIQTGQTVDGPGVRNEMDKKEQRTALLENDKALRKTDMVDWMEEQIPLLGLKPGTVKHYYTLIGRMHEYRKLMSWADLSVENICLFDNWLHKIKKPLSDADRKAGKEEEYISNSAVYGYHKCLKALLNRALLFDRIRRNPYEKLQGKFPRGDNENVDYLTAKEMKAIESLHPLEGSSMCIVRDLFVFQMHTGLSYADTQTFDIKEYRQIDGRYVNVGKREKNDVSYVVMLDKTCMEIIERYGMSLPHITNGDYNKCLKALGMAAGIEKPLHSHMARHTFATYMLASGARIENVSKMLGHTNIKQTQRYAKVLPESVLKDLKNVFG